MYCRLFKTVKTSFITINIILKFLIVYVFHLVLSVLLFVMAKPQYAEFNEGWQCESTETTLLLILCFLPFLSGFSIHISLEIYSFI